MERHFHEELRDLTARLAVMGALVESRARDAVEALVECRPDLAAEVASGDEAVNALELEIDRHCLRVLALQHPVASDLRRIRSIIKVNTDLERVGDQAVNIAQASIELMTPARVKPIVDVIALSDVALGMLHDSMTAFVESDVNRAGDVLERDNEADLLRDTVFRVLLQQMLTDPRTVRRALGLILVSRCLERIADHATNIAEDLIFIVDGRDVRHNREGSRTYGSAV